MANDNEVSLLFKLKSDAAGVKSGTDSARAAISALRQTFGQELTQMQGVSKNVFENISDHVNVFARERIPIAGNAIVGLSTNLRSLANSGAGAASKEIEALGKSIAGISKESGKSAADVGRFLTTFVQLETQAKRDKAAIDFFGAAIGPGLVPKLEAAGEELGEVAAASEAAAGGLAAIAGPVGIAVLALAGLAAVGFVVAKQIFEMTKAAAEFEGALFDLSQQTGVSVETLSALEVVAATTGGNLQSMTASLGIFQRRLEEAQDPLTKTAARFRQLNVQTSDTETALRQTLRALADMPEGFQQTAIALELFGRGGKSLLAVLKETGGDLDAVIEKARTLGILISTENAKAADEFNDQLALIGFQLRQITAELTREALPLILSSLQGLTTTLQQNREALKLLGIVVSAVAGLFTNELNKAMVAFNLTTLAARRVAQALAPVLHTVAEAYERIRRAINDLRFLPELPALKAPDVPEQPTAVTGPDDRTKQLREEIKSRVAAFDALTAVRKADVEEQKRLAAQEVANAELAFTQNRATRAKQVEDTIAANQRQIKSEIDFLQFQRRIVLERAALATDPKDRKDLFDQISAIDQEVFNKQNAADIAARKAREQLRLQERADALAHEKNLTAIALQAQQTRIDFIHNEVDAGRLRAAEGQRQIEEITTAGFNRQRAALAREIGLITTQIDEAKRAAASLTEGTATLPPEIARTIQQQVDELQAQLDRATQIKINATNESVLQDKRALDSLTQTLAEERTRLSNLLTPELVGDKRQEVLRALEEIEQTLKAAGQKFDADSAARIRSSNEELGRIVQEFEDRRVGILQSSQRRLDALVESGAKSRTEALREQNALELAFVQNSINVINRRLAVENLQVEERRRLNDQLAALDKRRTQLEEEQQQNRVNAVAEAQRKIQELLKAVVDPAERQRLSDQLKAIDEQETADRQKQANARRQIQQQSSQTQIQILLAGAENALRIAEVIDENRITSARALAERRVITEEEAEKRILQIRLDAIDREAEEVRARLTATRAITDPNERAKQEAVLNDQLKLLKAQRQAIEDQGVRDIDEARKKDLQNARDYAEQLDQIEESIRDIEREAAREIIDLMIQRHDSRRAIIRAQAELERDEENDRHDRAEDALRKERQENAASNRTAAEKERIRAAINRAAEAEEARHQAALERIRRRQRLDEKEADPLGRLKLGTDDLKEFAATLEETVVPLANILTDAFGQVADAIGQTVQNWVLLGETGPAVMRKILAQALASIAAEAAVNAIKEAALGFATLFFNPAESAAHFTAAGLWAGIAGGAGLAGRAIAGDLFKQKPASTRSGAGAGTGSGSDRNAPIDTIRPKGDQVLHIFVHAEKGPGWDRDVVRAVVSDVRTNGDMRTEIAKTSGA